MSSPCSRSAFWAPLLSGREVFLFAHLDVDLDRVDRRDRRQFLRGSRSDQVSDLRLGQARDAVHGGGHLGETQIELGLVDFGLGGEHRRAGRLFRADGIVEVFLADGILIGKGFDPGQVGLGRCPACLLGLELPLCLIQGRLEGARVDLEEDLPRPHEIAFLVVLPDEVSLDLGPDGGVHKPVEGPDPFLVDGNILLDDGRHLDGRRWRGFLGPLRAAHRDEEQQEDGQNVRDKAENDTQRNFWTPYPCAQHDLSPLDWIVLTLYLRNPVTVHRFLRVAQVSAFPGPPIWLCRPRHLQTINQKPSLRDESFDSAFGRGFGQARQWP